MIKQVLTQELVQSLFIYDSVSGSLVNKVNKGRALAGAISGTTHKNGTIYVRVLGKKEIAHRIIWLYVSGRLLTEIDHVDHDRSNNAWDNLREVSHAQNMLNKPIYKNSKTKCSGVSIDKRCGKYRAYIQVNCKQKSLGYFDTLEQAVAVRSAALKEHKYHANHGK